MVTTAPQAPLAQNLLDKPGQFIPSRYQQAIFDALETGTGDIQVQAVAGSGKTTTLEQALNRFPADLLNSTLVCAFNKEIANELGRRVPPSVTVKTIHSIGLSVIMQAMRAEGVAWSPQDKINGNKYRLMLNAYWLEKAGDTPEHEVASAIISLAHFCRVTLTDFTNPEAVEALADEYEVEIPKAYRLMIVNEIVPLLLAWGSQGRPKTDPDGIVRDLSRPTWGPREMIDYDDMLWLPHVLNLSPRQSKRVLVDECQDLSAAQLALVLKCRAEGGRMVFVGDPCQPEGTMVQTPGGLVSIETLNIGDRVTSYTPSDCAFVQKGRAVMGVSKRHYMGELVVVETGQSHRTRYTLNHHCFANFSPLRDKWAVYVMQRGAQFRVGKSQIDYGSDIGSGPVCRMRAEQADALWILDVYDTDAEARVMEAAISGKFGVPQLCFRSCNGDETVQSTIDRAWTFIGENVQQGHACLKAFGRDIRYPLFELQPEDQTHQSLKRPMIVRACNLIAGALMLPYGSDGHPRKSDWVAITVSRQSYSGFVYSLDVEKEHLYIGDGLVTHNCQAIYGFTGADVRSYQKIASITGAMQLPLSICWRCSRAVIERAKEIVPEIESAPDAAMGVVESVQQESFIGMVEPNDMVLCRVNAPLISMAFQLLAEGKRARVKGRDIGAQMIKLLDTVAKRPGFQFVQFYDYLEGWRQGEIAGLDPRKDNEMRVSSINDRAESLGALYGAAVSRGATSMADLRAEVQALFVDDGVGFVVLSSIHRAKGLEAKRVYILKPELMPHPMAKGERQVEQEHNLRYVAITRAKRELYFVVTPR